MYEKKRKGDWFVDRLKTPLLRGAGGVYLKCMKHFKFTYFLFASACGTWISLVVFLCLLHKRLRHLLFSILEDRITSKNQRFFPVIPGRGNWYRLQCTHCMRHFLCLCCFSKTEFWGAKRHKKCSLTGALQTMQRGWDSNPRCSCPHTNFPGLLLQPLGHLSRKLWVQITAFFFSK